ncbi:MAG: glutamate racemase [Thermodesulfovibrionales bacterium]
MDNRPIGVFDSGIGGLTVLKEIIKELPNEGIIYLGDTARVPYGIRSPETVTRYSIENASFLASKGIKMLIVACNTASAISLDGIREKFNIPVLGVISPGARAAVAATRNKKIAVIGTEATINSNAYTKHIKSLAPEMEVIGLACPLFVPLVEEGLNDDEIARLVARRYLSGLVDKEIDTLVLGCTHYPLLKDVIAETVGKDIVLIDSAVETAREAKVLIQERGMGSNKETDPLRKFYVTDSPERFKRVGERFLGGFIKDIEKIYIGGF